jgi:hypothetical protein
VEVELKPSQALPDILERAPFLRAEIGVTEIRELSSSRYLVSLTSKRPLPNESMALPMLHTDQRLLGTYQLLVENKATGSVGYESILDIHQPQAFYGLCYQESLQVPDCSQVLAEDSSEKLILLEQKGLHYFSTAPVLEPLRADALPFTWRLFLQFRDRE